MKAYNYIQPRSKMEDAALFWILMSFAGASLGDKVYVDWAGKPVYPNLPLLLVAPSGSGKTFAMSLAKRVFGRELPYQIPEDSTAESAAKVLSKYGNSRFRNSVGLWVMPEMTDIMGKKDYQQGLVARITRLLDNPYERAISRSTKDEILVIPGIAVLTWVAGTTFEWLSEHTEEAIGAGGFLPRLNCIYLEGLDRKFVPNPKRDEKVERDLEAELRNLIDDVAYRDPKVIDLDSLPEWESISKGIYEEILQAQHNEPHKVPFISRRDEHTVRIYLILNTLTQTFATLSQAEICAKWLENQTFRLTNHLEFRNFAVYQRVLRSCESSAEGVSFAQLSRNTRLDSGQLAYAIEDLVNRGLLEWNPKAKGETGIIRYVKEREKDDP